MFIVVRFELLAAVSLNIRVFGDDKLCRSSRTAAEAEGTTIFRNVGNYRWTRLNIPEDLTTFSANNVHVGDYRLPP